MLTYTADHRGSLEDCLKTEKTISYDVFWNLINAGIYKFYTYDQRIKAFRYLLIDLENNLGLPAWLHYYGKRRPI